MGRKVGLVGGWVKIFDDYYESEMMMWMAQQLAKAAAAEGGTTSSILMVTLMPEIDLDRVEDQTYVDLADQCAYINLHYGVPLLLRFAHEMNGEGGLLTNAIACLPRLADSRFCLFAAIYRQLEPLRPKTCCLQARMGTLCPAHPQADQHDGHALGTEHGRKLPLHLYSSHCASR